MLVFSIMTFLGLRKSGLGKPVMNAWRKLPTIVKACGPPSFIVTLNQRFIFAAIDDMISRGR